MSKRGVKWRDVERYFRRHGYEITGSGGDKIIKAPPGKRTAGTRTQVRIGHRFCSHPGDTLRPGHLSKIRNAFGVSASDILDDQ